MSKKDKEVESEWEDTWKDILVKEDGSIDVEQLKRELFDYSQMIDRMCTLTHEVTGYRLSKPNYPVSVIMDEVEDFREQELKNRMIDDREVGICSFCEQDLPHE